MVYIYYIDAYIDNDFFSRSEPFFNKEECIGIFNRLNIDPDQYGYTKYTYKIQISMDLNEFEQLELKSHRLKIKYIYQPISSTPDNDTDVSLIQNITLNAYRFLNGYIFLINEKNRELLLQYDLLRHCSHLKNIKNTNGNGGWFLMDFTMAFNRICIPKLFDIKQLPHSFIL